MYGFGKECKELDMIHLIWFRRAYGRVKLCPIYQKVCNMLRRDMLSELGDSMDDNEEYIKYNLSGCDYPNTDDYWIMWAHLSSGRTIRVVGEASRFITLSRLLQKAGSNTPIGRYRRYEEDNTEHDSDEEYYYIDSYTFIQYHDYDDIYPYYDYEDMIDYNIHTFKYKYFFYGLPPPTPYLSNK